MTNVPAIGALIKIADTSDGRTGQPFNTDPIPSYGVVRATLYHDIITSEGVDRTFQGLWVEHCSRFIRAGRLYP